MSEDTLRVLGIGDSPKLTTGFGNVTGPLYPHFAEEFDFMAFGWMDHDPDVNNELGYKFYPTQIFDPLGTSGTGLTFVRAQEPDVVWIIADPGNIRTYTEQIVNLPEDERPAIVAYCPIEGWPLNSNFGVAFQQIQETGGKLVVYCQHAKDTVVSQFPEIEPLVVPHGADHAPFRPYSQEDRRLLRRAIGWEDYFVVGSVGVNKRTKGFDTLIYAASYMKRELLNEGIVFYFHTDPDLPTMAGYPLKDMAEIYDVADMIMFKPDNNRIVRGNVNLGTKTSKNTLAWIRAQDVVDDPKERVKMFMEYDFLSRLNCLDVYFDASKVEGWGLPQMEAMSCGIPVICPEDYGVRSEIHTQAAFIVPTTEPRTWETWHTGARLLNIDPKDIAESIIELKNDVELRKTLIEKGLTLSSQYKWANSAEMMKNIIREVGYARRERRKETDSEDG